MGLKSEATFGPCARMSRCLNSARGATTLASYGAADGVPREVFRQSSGFVTDDGIVMIGSNNGLVAFDPTLVEAQTDPSPVVFTDFQLANKSAAIGNGSPLATDINDTQSITLDYTDRVISFKFAVLDYRAPEASRYRYILEGFDTDWTEVDSKRRLVTYTNLDPGQYTFRVTASNADDVWNETGRAINLVITPPWYGTLWFRGLLLLLLVGGILLFYRWRINNLETRRRALEQGIAQRTVDLAHANTSLQAEISERKQFEEALQQSNNDLAALNQIAQELTQWGDLPGALRTVGGMISALFGKAAVGIWLLDPERTSLVRLFAVDPVQGVDLGGQSQRRVTTIQGRRQQCRWRAIL